MGGRWPALGALLVGALACGPKHPADWPKLGHEVTIYVAVSRQVAETDTGNVAAMVDVIESGLHEDGHVVSVEGARRGERPPVPRIEIQVQDSDSGNAKLRGAGNLSQLLFPVTGVAIIGAGSGHILVDVYLVPGHEQRARFVGRFAGASGGSALEDAVTAGTEAGNEVLDAIRE
jgi:hypothetical protein